MGVEKDADARERETEGEEHEGQRVACFGRNEAIQYRERPRGCKRRYAVQLCLDCRVFEPFDDGGEEIAQAVADYIAAWGDEISGRCRG